MTCLTNHSASPDRCPSVGRVATLSDNGNTFAVSGVPGFPYSDGCYSNGLNWVDYFPGIAEQVHVDISPATAWLHGAPATSTHRTALRFIAVKRDRIVGINDDVSARYARNWIGQGEPRVNEPQIKI